MTEQAAPRNNRPKKSPAPVIAAPAADPDKIALAREQMRQKLNAASGQENPATGATPQPVVTTAPPAQPPPVGEQAPPAAEKPKKPVPTKPTVATTEPPPAKTPAKPVKQPKQPTAQMTPVQEATYKPLEGPASPVNASQRQRLDELLSRYQADQVTPEQYHQERAKILAQP